MTLQEIFTHLAAGPLSQLSIGGQGAGVINEANQAKVIPHIDLALKALYKRFALKEGRVLLQPVADQETYYIVRKYAVTANAPVANRYLKDTAAAPFKGDVLKIERVLTDASEALALNVEGDRYAAHTPTANALQLPLDVVNQVDSLPDWLKTTQLQLVYRAGHARLEVDADLESDLVQLPDTHLEPLLYFVASGLHMPTGMSAQEKAGNPYMVQYELACQALENQGYQKDQSAGRDLLHERGFV
jgi:hypothetical protein